MSYLYHYSKFFESIKEYTDYLNSCGYKGVFIRQMD